MKIKYNYWNSISIVCLQILLLLNIQLSLQTTQYIDRLPNGRNIPCPPGGLGCQNGKCWGSGHMNRDGLQACDGNPYFPTNKFGNDFIEQGRNWNYNYCTMDSDGDGRTNGDELGDPCCTWKAASPTSLRTTDLSHPGTNSSKSTRASCLLDGVPSAISAPKLQGNSNKMVIEWSLPSSSCACGFFIYKKIASGGFKVVSKVSNNVTSFVDNDIQLGTEYSYYIIASNLAGNSSEGVHAVYNGASTQAPPSAGNSPKITAASTSTISLQWTPADDNGNVITSYNIERNGTIINSGNILNMTDSSLIAHTLYAYRVRAINSAGYGNFSEYAYFHTNSLDATVVTQLELPAIVSGDRYSLEISWNSLISSQYTILSYTLQMKQYEDTEYKDIYTGLDSSFTVTNLNEEPVYFFRWRVLNTVGYSAFSEPLITKTLFCLNDCSGRGECDPFAHTCNCTGGFGGEDCSTTSLSPTIDSSEYINTASITENFVVYWTIKEGDQIEVAIKAKTTGYVAIGFSPQRVASEAHMIVGWVANGTVHLYEYGNHDESAIYPSNFSSVMSYNGEESEDGYTTIKFIRKLDSGNPSDVTITKGVSNLMYAMDDTDPADRLSVKKHKTTDIFRGWASVDWFSGKVQLDNGILIAHGVMMTIASLLFGIAMLRKYFRKFIGKRGIYVHYSLTSAGVICMLCGLLLGIWINSSTRDSSLAQLKSVHSWFGFLITICSFVFPTLGVLADQPNHQLKKKFFPYYMHQILERVAVYGGITNGAVGLKYAKASNVIFGIYMAIFLLLIILHEVGFVVMTVIFNNNDGMDANITFSNSDVDVEKRKSRRKSKPVFTTITPQIHTQAQSQHNTFSSTSTIGSANTHTNPPITATTSSTSDKRVNFNIPSITSSMNFAKNNDHSESIESYELETTSSRIPVSNNQYANVPTSLSQTSLTGNSTTANTSATVSHTNSFSTNASSNYYPNNANITPISSIPTSLLSSPSQTRPRTPTSPLTGRPMRQTPISSPDLSRNRGQTGPPVPLPRDNELNIQSPSVRRALPTPSESSGSLNSPMNSPLPSRSTPTLPTKMNKPTLQPRNLTFTNNNNTNVGSNPTSPSVTRRPVPTPYSPSLSRQNHGNTDTQSPNDDMMGPPDSPSSSRK